QSPGVGHCIINEQNPSFESFRQFVTKPFIESSATGPRSHALNPVAQFGQRDDAYENAILVHIREPSDNAWIGARFNPLGADICIQQKGQRSAFLRPPLLRSTLSVERRSGEAAKNSARLPLRFVFFSHSSTATTTTAVRPLRVIVCGPSERALSITSLNLAFASATLQTPVCICLSSSHDSHDGHDGHPICWAEGVRSRPPHSVPGRQVRQQPKCNCDDRLPFDAYSLSLTAGTPSISTEGSTPKAPAKRQILTRLGLRCPRSMP